MTEQVKQELKSIKIIHAALMIGVLSFLLIATFITQTVGEIAFKPESFEAKILLIVSNSFAVIAIVAGTTIFKKRLKDVSSLDLTGKLTKYREAMIIRSATIESAAFFFIVCFFLTGSYVFLAEGVFVLSMLIYYFPGNYRIANETNHNIKDLI